MTTNNTDKVNLDKDKQELLSTSLRKLAQAASHVNDLLKKDTLTSEFSKNLTFLMESHFSEIAEILDYDSHVAKEQEKRYLEIREANKTIQELQAKLGSEKSVDGLAEQLKHLYSVVREWWTTEGFNHISEEKFSPYGGLHLQFHFMLDSPRTFSKTPSSDRSASYNHKQHLIELGFEFAETEDDQVYKNHLIDNEKNRNLLINMLKTRFPSLEVHSIKNLSSRDTGQFLIWHVEASIYDLTDI